MYTQCPQCSAIFQLSASQLKAANGEVRCGQCLSVFNALAHLSEDVPHGQQIDTTAQLAEETQAYRQWSADSATPAAAANAASGEQAPTDAKDDDVFRELAAEVSNHPIPEAAIEQFEEFLDSAPPPAGTAAHNVATTEPTPAPEADAALTPASEKIAVAPEQTAEPAVDPATVAHPAPTASAHEDSPPASSPAVFSIDTSEPPEEQTPLGDVEDATVDLHTRIPVDDDEFAELNAFLNDDEASRADAVRGLETKAEDQPIIIEDTDLAPVDSPDYHDTPPSDPTHRVDESDVDTQAEAAQAQTQSGAASPTPHIPSVILDELQAAKAERLRPRNTPWVVGSLVLMLTLVLQVVYHSRDHLARDPALRPWLIRMCDLLHCSLSQPYDIQQIEIIGRDVRSHPSAPHALIVSTTLINNADFVQPFPLLTMVFSDINGNKIAQRRFIPREYLDNSMDLDAGMPPDLPVRIELALVDPGKAAVNYEFYAEADPRRTRPLH